MEIRKKKSIYFASKSVQRHEFDEVRKENEQKNGFR